MHVVGKYVDRLITLEMRPGNFPLRGYIDEFHRVCCEKLGVTSLTLLAAQKILAQVQPGDNVFILTGLASKPFLPHGETDGPLGAACLARAVSLGLDAKPIFVLGERDIDSVKYPTKAAGVNIEDYDTVSRAKHCAAILPFPHDSELAKTRALELVDQYQPKAVFSVETPGPNTEEVLHTALGYAHPAEVAKLYHIFDVANERGILTIAGLDVGNEIGGGSIEEEVRRVIPTGNVCKCPCKSGIASRVPATVAIPVATSNWAAYGIAAMLGFLKTDPRLLQDPDTEQRMLEACCMAGAIDGVSFRPIPVVDGMSAEANRSVVRLLHEIVSKGLAKEELKRPI